MQYKVTWHPLAQLELAQTWLDSRHKDAVAQAADEIREQLADDPENSGTKISDRSRELTVDPLQVLFRVAPSNKTVEIFSVAEII